jgi:arylsulfatase A-like enzyme
MINTNLKYMLLMIISFAGCTTKEKGRIEIAVQKPNIILIMADDLGYGSLSSYGSETISTPHLDKMAREGIKFTDFHSNGAVCSPTRAALLTGKYQQRVGIEGVVTAKSHRDVGLAIEEVTFADALKEEGYVTGIMGKWHLGYPERLNPIHQGFDEFKGYVSGNVDYHSHIDQEAYEDWWWQNKLRKEKGYSTDLITKHSIAFINKHKEVNFLLYIPHESPHGPFQGRGSQAYRVIGDNTIPNPEKNIKGIYKEMIEVMDEGIGEVIATLQELELDKKTLVIFCSDNGPAAQGSSGGLRGAKGSVWEGGHRVPAIAWWPETIKPNQVIDETIMTMDLFPTMLSLSGSSKKLNLDGVSISDLLIKNQPLEKRDLFWRHFSNDGHHQSAAVRSGNWKLIRNGKNRIPELFNLQTDLFEKTDLASSHVKLRDELIQKLKTWERETTEGVVRKSP